MGDFNFHFENIETTTPENYMTSQTCLTYPSLFLDLLTTKATIISAGLSSTQSNSILIFTKLHHGLTSDHTAILCKLDVSVPVQKPDTFSYHCLKKIDTGAFKQDLSQAVSQASSINDYNKHLCSVLDKHAPLCPYKEADALVPQYCGAVL